MAASHHIPGVAMTVMGPVAPESLGVTLMHEHLFLGGGSRGPGPGTPATQVALWGQPLSLERLHLARDGVSFKDLALDDEALAVREAQAFRSAGGRTMVDTSNVGMGRDPLALRRVSTVTGLNIVMGCGWYTPVSHPWDMDARTPEDLAEEMVRDITAGVGETGHTVRDHRRVGDQRRPAVGERAEGGDGRGVGQPGDRRGHITALRRPVARAVAGDGASGQGGRGPVEGDLRP